jgi:hypothetical protein
MYCDAVGIIAAAQELPEQTKRLPWTIITGSTETAGRYSASIFARTPAGQHRPRLLLAGRQALPGFHPLQQRGLGVTDRPAHLDVRRAVAAHARLGEPGQADLKKLGGFLRRQQHDGRSGRIGPSIGFGLFSGNVYIHLLSGGCPEMDENYARTFRKITCYLPLNSD